MAALRPCVLHPSRPATSSGRLVCVFSKKIFFFFFSLVLFSFFFFLFFFNKKTISYHAAKFLFRLAMSDDDDDLCRSAPLENQIKNQLGNSLCENFGRV